MIDRGFCETDLRQMREHVTNHRPDLDPARWVIETNWVGRPREVIVEPIDSEKLLLVVTAFVVG